MTTQSISSFQCKKVSKFGCHSHTHQPRRSLLFCFKSIWVWLLCCSHVLQDHLKGFKFLSFFVPSVSLHHIRLYVYIAVLKICMLAAHVDTNSFIKCFLRGCIMLKISIYLTRQVFLTSTVIFLLAS